MRRWQWKARSHLETEPLFFLRPSIAAPSRKSRLKRSFRKRPYQLTGLLKSRGCISSTLVICLDFKGFALPVDTYSSSIIGFHVSKRFFTYSCGIDCPSCSLPEQDTAAVRILCERGRPLESVYTPSSRQYGCPAKRFTCHSRPRTLEIKC